MTATREDRGILPDEEPIGTVLDRTCIGCGVDYQWTSREGYQWPTSYCTRSCKRKSSPKRRIKLGATDKVETEAAGMVLLLCARCEEPFGWSPREGATGTLRAPSYCSQTCQGAAHEKRKKLRRQAQVATAEQREHVDQEQRRAAEVTEMAEAARQLMLPAGRCVSCGKVASPTKADAKRMKREIEAKAGRTNEVRYYECPDGWWHWTRLNATLEGWRTEREINTSPASLRHQGRGAWRHLSDLR